MKINVRVIPNAKINKITVDNDGDFRIHITTVPEDGKANIAVIKLLAKHFDVPKSDIKIIRGSNIRDKIITVGD